MNSIVHIVPKLNTGGLQKVCIGLSNASRKKGYKVSIISLSDVGSDSLVKELDSEVSFYSLSRNNAKIDFSIFSRLSNLLREIGPSVVHTHGISLFYASRFILQNRYVSYVHTIHNIANKDGGFIRRKIQRILFKYFSVKPVVLSPQISDSFKLYYGFRPSAIIENASAKIIPTDLLCSVAKEIEGYKVNRDDKVVINVGRICEQKNQQLLVDSFKMQFDSEGHCILIVLGVASSSDDFEVEHRLRQGLDGYPIFFLGNKSNVGDYLLNSDVFCLSSKYEGFPISILEALSCGLPILSTDVGGVSDVIKSTDFGLISQRDNIADYSEKFAEIIKNSSSYDNVKAKAYFSSNFTYDKVTEKYLKVYF